MKKRRYEMLRLGLAILNIGVMKILIAEGDKKVNHGTIWEHRFLSSENNCCKGPEAQECSVHSSEEASEDSGKEATSKRGRKWVGECRGPDQVGHCQISGFYSE